MKAIITCSVYFTYPKLSLLLQDKLGNHNFDTREPVGLMSRRRIQLIKKDIVSERSLVICNSLDIHSLDISNVKITSQSIDSTMAIITASGRSY